MFSITIKNSLGFPEDSVVNNPPANAGEAGDAGLTAGSGRSLKKETATPSRILDYGAQYILSEQIEGWMRSEGRSRCLDDNSGSNYYY